MKTTQKQRSKLEAKRRRERRTRRALILAVGYRPNRRLTKCRRTGADLRGGPAAILGI